MVAHHNDKPETLPCTLSLQFVLNRLSDSVQTLHTYVNMRSNDLVWGLPTDIIQFGGIAQMVASCTSSVATTVVVNCGDSHIYDATRLKEDQHFELAGEFSIPALYTLEAYKDWAAKALSLGRGVQKPRYACEYVPAEGTVETA
jgi:hypothetical protein